MKILSNLFGKGLDKITGLVDNLTLSKEEKEAFKLEIQSQLLQQQKELEETYRTALNSRADIIKAELAQGDTFTKRARPMIIYAGLFFIFVVYVIVPIIFMLKNGIADFPRNEVGQIMMLINLPEEFWWAWGTVVGVYGAGRSAEKLGAANRVTNLITGSNAYKVNEEVKG